MLAVALTVPARSAPANLRAVEPATILRGYASALALLARPKALSFDYTVSQLGLHDMEQMHHVYRSGLDERDETLSVVVSGTTLAAATVRIIRNRTYRYDIATIAPRADRYAFVASGARRIDGGYVYRFRTVPRGQRAFAVSEIDIDGGSLLPAVVHFHIAGGGARGEGVLIYGRSDSRWVVREARVNAHLSNGSTARERIVWSNYRFYEALPRSTFDAPKPAVTATPPPISP